jgi:hypothetical protein
MNLAIVLSDIGTAIGPVDLYGQQESSFAAH